MSLSMEQDSSLIQVRLASRKKFSLVLSLKEISGIPNLVKEDSESSALTPARSSTPLMLCYVFCTIHE